MDNTEQANIYITGAPEEEGRKKGVENLFKEIITKNFPNIQVQEIDIQVQEGNRHSGSGSTDSSKQDELRRSTSQHIIIKTSKIKDKERL